MATVAGLLHHLIDHAPGLSDTNRQEYHEAVDEVVAEAMPAPEEQAPEEQAPEGQ